MPAQRKTPTAAPMRLFILGATGGTGRAVLDQATQRGHSMTAFVRSPEKLTAFRDRLVIRQGDPRRADELLAALPGHDAVLSALGPPGPGRSTILREAARATVHAMQAAGVRRLLVVSAAVLFEDAGLLATLLRRTLLRHVAQDSAAMERIVRSSGLEWTIVRPPRLTNWPHASNYVVADGHMPKGGRLCASRADVAHFLLEEVVRPAHIHCIVGLAAPKVVPRKHREAEWSEGPVREVR